MLVGEFEHTIDEKNRLKLPAKFRSCFGEKIWLTQGVDGCLDVYPDSDWQRLVQRRYSDLDPFDEDARLLARQFFPNAADVIPDKQGRVTVPTPLVQKGGLSRDVVIAGVGDHLEIWDRDTWIAHVQELERRAKDAAKRLAAKHN